MQKQNKPKHSDHFDGKRFFNPKSSFTYHNVFKALKMWLTTPQAKWPEQVVNTGKPVLNHNLTSHQLAVTFINHASFLLQIGGLNILTDPVWSKRVSPFKFVGPKRVREPGISFYDLPNIDLVIISHNHYDHLDLSTLRMLACKYQPKVIVPIGDKSLVQSTGIKNVEELDWWQSITINENTSITFTPTKHFSARGLFDHNLSLWGSYVIKSDGKKIYFGGDAAYSHHYNEIYNKFGAIDISLLGIGAYEPDWFMREHHMNPAEAVQAHLELHSKLSIGMHFGTFQLSAEAIDQPVVDLRTALKNLGVSESDFIVVEEGDTKVFSL